jgi:hypothetical protein
LETGKPAAVSAAAVASRVRNASGFSGMPVTLYSITLRANALGCDGLLYFTRIEGVIIRKFAANLFSRINGELTAN